jgi:hypothetical protein
VRKGRARAVRTVWHHVAAEVSLTENVAHQPATIRARECPSCGDDEAPKRPKWTWWGGMLGPKLFHHAICTKCGTGYDAKTGKPNKGPITIYLVVSFVLFLALFAALRAI